MAIITEEIESFCGRYQIERQSRTGEITAVIGICSNCGRQWDDGAEGIALLRDGWLPWICRACTEALAIRRC